MGRIAYEAWTAGVEQAAAWDELPLEIQSRWEAVAKAVVIASLGAGPAVPS